MLSKALQSAIDCLKIKDINLYSSNVSQSTNDDEVPFFLQADVLKQIDIENKVGMSKTTSFEDKLVLIYFDLGARYTKDNEVLATIEAKYVAIYSCDSKLSDEALEEFAMRNSIIHVWPYWREFLSSQSSKMGLPKLIVPTLQLEHHAKRESEQT